MAASPRRRDAEAVVVEWVPLGGARQTDEFLVLLFPPELINGRTLAGPRHSTVISHVTARQ